MTMQSEDQKLRADLCGVGKRMYDKGLIAAADGNISVRTAAGEIYVTPSGACKGEMRPEDIVVTDGRGQKLRGERKPSSELEMHIAVYEARPDVLAVVHAHPPLATGFAAAGVPLSPALLSEIILTLGCVPLTEYATPTTSELPRVIRAYAAHYDGLLLANHGAVTLGKDAWDAYFKMETVEHYAKINLVTKVLGVERPLPLPAVEKLMELKRKAGLRDSDPYCGFGPAASVEAAAAPACAAGTAGMTGTAGTPAGDTITLTRAELVDLVMKAIAAEAR
jgi:L-fuculose-phosphate aldolase